MELEIKLFVSNLARLERRVVDAGGELSQARILEMNLRFDTPELSLAHSARVLRLRQDTAAWLTYKGPSFSREGVRARQEIEFAVGDFRTAQAFLEALGYQVSLRYEKYRTVYELDGTHVTLDEMPYGDFAEIEGPDPTTIRAVCMKLGLDWEARCGTSYTQMFESLREALGLSFRDLSFANFEGIEVRTEDLGVRSADNS